MSRQLKIAFLLLLSGCQFMPQIDSSLPVTPSETLVSIFATRTPLTSETTPLPTLLPEQPSPTEVAISSPSATEEPPTPTATPTSTPDGRAAEVYEFTEDLGVFLSYLRNFMPKSGSEGFLNPGEADLLVFRSFTEGILSGDFGNVLDLAPSFDYEILLVSDLGDDLSQSYLLREPLPYKRGWGLFVFRKDTPNNIVIEIPHPLFDENTDQIGLDLFRLLDARALFIAGAHRFTNADGSADMSHNPMTVFQTAHQALADSGEMLVLQLHGFASDQRPNYPQIILGNATTGFNASLEDLAKQLEEIGISAGICDGLSWTDLCGETNIQGSTMTRGVFIHIEIAPDIRADPGAFLMVLSDWVDQVSVP